MAEHFLLETISEEGGAPLELHTEQAVLTTVPRPITLYLTKSNTSINTKKKICRKMLLILEGFSVEPTMLFGNSKIPSHECLLLLPPMKDFS